MATIPLKELAAHAREYFTGHPCAESAWPHGPTAALFPDAYTLVFGKGPQAAHPVYVTIGAANVRPGYHREFVLCAAKNSAIHIETMAMLTHYHHTEGLDVGHTLPIGRPWCDGAAQDYFLISLPYPFGPALENLSVGGCEVRFLWALPIFKSEAVFRHKEGLEALESRFDAAAIDILATRRAPVA